ncbi:hypothetical protein [Parasitella parasitica]|uniref:Uncharacterized protein n=1 Tax=Parasitella parasitica TaxID=35722 RepID=A0A0B7MYM9_9FUNG|nr:hypothetical protein [Parasitella parasitica]
MNDYIKVSFEKLESFDMHRSSLRSFVLIRNSLAYALTKQHNDYNELLRPEQEHEQNEVQVQTHTDEANYGLSNNEDQEVWLASCFNQLDQDEDYKPLFDEYDSEDDEDDEDDSMPSSPQENNAHYYKKKPTFFINEEDEEEDDGLICYDIPFLSL